MTCSSLSFPIKFLSYVLSLPPCYLLEVLLLISVKLATAGESEGARTRTLPCGQENLKEEKKIPYHFKEIVYF
jgi:hypothetical protein